MGNYTSVNYSAFVVSGDADLCWLVEVATASVDLCYKADDTGLLLFMMKEELEYGCYCAVVSSA